MRFPQTQLTPSQRLGLIKTKVGQVADSELLTHRLYQHLSTLDYPCPTPGLATLSQNASIEDMDHYWLMRAAITRLNSVEALPTAYPDWQIRDPELAGRSLQELLQILCDAEARLVKGYQDICALAIELDYQIFDVAFRNLQENAFHHSSLECILHQQPAGDAIAVAGRSHHAR